MITFEESGLSPEIIKAIKKIGFETFMPVQQQVIPHILNTERDIITLSQTGSGKTAAYGLPLLNRIDPTNKNTQLLVLSPTRELCLQIANDLTSFSQFIPGMNIVAVYGGAAIDTQIKSLRAGAQVIVATPGRLTDLLNRRRADVSHIVSVVLDEADEMLDMGFADELNAILANVPKERRTLLFSATMSREVASIANGYMQTPLEIVVGDRNAGADNIKHLYYVVQASHRYLALKRIVDFYPDIYGIVFCRTRAETAEIAEKLMKDGYNADALHGDLSQTQRDYAMQRFRLRNLQILVATDVAARGLDVDDLTHIINYNLPDDAEVYTHRSGRTGRAGKSGISISIIHSREKHRIALIERMVKHKFNYMPVPSGEEVCRRQLFSNLDRIEKVEVNEEQISAFIPEVIRKLSGLDKEELLKRFVSIEFNRYLEYYKNAEDLNVVEKPRPDRDRISRRVEGGHEGVLPAGEFTVMRLNAGADDGLNVKMLIGMVNDFTRNRSIAIGRATIRPMFTLFEIDSTRLDEVMSGFRNRMFDNRKVVLEVARRKDQEQFQHERALKGKFSSRRENDQESFKRARPRKPEGGDTDKRRTDGFLSKKRARKK